MQPCFDALVLGAGPAGSTSAVLLAQAGWKVALAEKTAFPRRKVCGEFVSATNTPVLEKLGVLRAFEQMAGPAIWQVGLFTGRDRFVAPMPCPESGPRLWGRALSREKLDLVLVERARSAGVKVWQPWSVVQVRKADQKYCCRIQSRENGASEEVCARILIAAHGSWWPGRLPSHFPFSDPRGSDLLAFKTHVLRSRLSKSMMPLMAFPGGYGGMVHCDDDRMSLSFCVRRDRLERWRCSRRGVSAAEVVLQEVQEICGGLRDALENAQIEEAWLSAGPIRPGTRACTVDGGIFLVGNAAGEAHPAIAEGISLALQSSWILCEQLAGVRDARASPDALIAAREGYKRAWRRNIAWRIRASAVVAHWAMSRRAVSLTRPLLQWWPSILAVGARAGGKAPPLGL